MATTELPARCAPEAVFSVLADGWLYPAWVVGASRMRSVEPDWPAAGSCLHHSVGTWPLLLDDTTESIAWDPPHRMEVQARGWPLGEARVVITAEPTAEGCILRIEEDAVAGPGRLLPKPLRDVMIGLRNIETLKRLRYLSEGGAA